MLNKKNNFSGGVNGTAITTANSGGASGDAFDTVDPGATYTTTHATGSRSPMACAVDANAVLSWSGITITDQTLYVRMYMWMPNTLAVTDACLQIGDSGGTGVSIYLVFHDDGTISLENDFGPLIQTTSVHAVNQWIRVELKVVIGTISSNGSVELRLYNSADSTTATDTQTLADTDTGITLPDQCDFWGFYSDKTTYYLDDVAISDVGWPGPESGPTTTPKSASDAATLTQRAAILGGLAPADTVSLTAVAALMVDQSHSDTGVLAEAAALASPAQDGATLGEQSLVALYAADGSVLADNSVLTQHTGPVTGDASVLVEAALLTVDVWAVDGAVVADGGGPALPVAAADASTLTEAAAVLVDRPVRLSAGSPYVEWSADLPFAIWAASGPYL